MDEKRNWTRDERNVLGRPLLRWDICPHCGCMASDHYAAPNDVLACPSIRPAEKVSAQEFATRERLIERLGLVGKTVEDLVAQERLSNAANEGRAQVVRLQRELEQERRISRRLTRRQEAEAARKREAGPGARDIVPGQRRGYFDE